MLILDCTDWVWRLTDNRIFNPSKILLPYLFDYFVALCVSVCLCVSGQIFLTKP